MKVIIVGASGFIGNAVLQRCLATPEITSIILLSRRQLSGVSDPKVTSITHTDFKSYPDELLKMATGASACIWCMGIPLTKAGNITDKEAHAIEVDYPLAAARAFASATSTTFRFVYTSGRIAERDENKSLWILAHARRLKGEAERALLSLAESTPNLHVVLTRPAGVYSPVGINSLLPCLPGISIVGISAEELAAFDVGIALDVESAETEANGRGATFDNAAMVQRGRLLLASMP